MADSMTKQVTDTTLRFKEELKKAIEAYVVVPVRAIQAYKECAARDLA